MVKISALPPSPGVDGADPNPGNDQSAGGTVKWTFTQLKAWFTSTVDWVTALMIDFSTMPTSKTIRIDSLAAGSTNSASYVDIPNNAVASTTTFTKKYSATKTKLVVRGHMGQYFSTTPGSIWLAASINGVDRQLAAYFDNTANQGRSGPNGETEVTGLNAGTYTCKLRIKGASGSNIAFDANFDAHLTIEEVPV